MKLILIIVLSFSISQNNAESKQCYAKSPPWNETYSWYTGYPASRRSDTSLPNDCKLIYVWGLTRHGTRYPCKKDTKLFQRFHIVRDEILSNHKKGRGKLCKEDLENLKNWKTNVTLKVKMLLTNQGIRDSTFLGEKIKEKFSIFLKSSQHKDSLFQFQSSDTNRTIQTALLFKNAYLGRNDSSVYGNHIEIDDKFLRPEEYCEKYYKVTKKLSKIQPRLFRKSSHWKNMAEDLRIRLGYKNRLPHGNITDMYVICAFEKAWYPTSKPPLCAVFSKKDLRVLEYYIDMSLYYKRGYGNHLADNLGCPLVRDMMLSLSRAAEDSSDSSPKGKFLFTHSETVLPVTVKLGLSQDKIPPTAKNYPKLVDKRKWKTAHFDGFTANVMAALYQCFNDSKHTVVFYQNEYPVKHPKCSSIFCPLTELKKIFEDVFDENKCNVDFCST